MRAVAVLTLGLVGLLSEACPADDDVFLERVLNTWRERQNHIKSATFEFEIAVSYQDRSNRNGKLAGLQGPTEDSIYTSHHVLKYDGLKIRKSSTRPRTLPDGTISKVDMSERIQVFDGEQSTYLKTRTHGQGYQGHISRDRSAPTSGFPVFLPIVMSIRPFSPSSLWPKALEDTGRTRKLGATQCRIYTYGEQECWIDEAHPHTIRRYVFPSPSLTRLDIQYKDDPDHGALPVKWTETKYNRSKKQISTVQIIESSVNVPIDPAEFNIEFPTWTIVLIEEHQLAYIVGPDRIPHAVLRTDRRSYEELVDEIKLKSAESEAATD